MSNKIIDLRYTIQFHKKMKTSGLSWPVNLSGTWDYLQKTGQIDRYGKPVKKEVKTKC